MPKETILAVVNPIAGDVDKSPMVDHIAERLSGEHPFEVYETTGDADGEAIAQCVQEHNPGRILVLGGDGTVKTVVEALGENRIPLGIVPTGSANGLATDLNLPEGWEAAVDVALNGREQALDVLQLNGHMGLHISDVGLNAELICGYEGSNFRGLFGYALQSVPTLIKSAAPWSFRLQANGKTRDFEAVMVAFANSRRFGTGAVVNPIGQIDDGQFEVLLFKKLDPARILETIRNQAPIESDFLDIVQTDQAVLTMEHPIAFQVDGEFLGETRRVEVGIAPRRAVVVVPNA